MLQLVNALDSKNPKYLRQLKRLFKQAFPRFERKPWWLLQRTAAAGQAELLAVCDSNQPGRFCGLAICLFWQDLVLLDYFAVCPQQRNQGLGRQILPLLRQRYAGRRLLLETERPGSPHTPIVAAACAFTRPAAYKTPAWPCACTSANICCFGRRANRCPRSQN